MVIFARCGQTAIYGDDAMTPRVLLRPAIMAFPDTLVLDEAMARRGIFWVLPKPTLFAEAAGAAAWLEAQVAQQLQMPEGQISNRIAFGWSDGNTLCVLQGDRLGRFPMDLAGLRPFDGNQGTLNYALTLDASALSLAGDELVLTPRGPGHSFRRLPPPGGLRVAFAVAEIRLSLAGPKAGLVSGTGLTGNSLDPAVPTGLDYLLDAGLANRFTHVVAENTPWGTVDYATIGHEAALLHGGDGGRRAARFDLSLDPFDPFDPARSYLRPRPAGDGEPLVLTLPTALGHDVSVEPTDAPAFLFTRHPLFDAGGAVAGHEDTMSLSGTFRVLGVPGEMLALAQAPLDVAELGLVPGFAPSETLLPQTQAAAAAGDLFVSFEPGPAVDLRGLPRPSTLAAEGGAADALALESMPGPAHGVTSWMRVHRGDGGVTRMLAEPPSSRNLVAQAGLLTHHALDLDVDSDRVPARLQGFVPVLPARGTVEARRADAQGFDATKLSHERRKLAHPAGYGPGAAKLLPAAAQVPARSTTPLGFEIERQADGRISGISFAVSPGQAGEIHFGLKGGTPDAPGPLLPEVADALIRNRLFLVANTIPEPSAAGATYLEGEVRVGRWPFRAGIPGERQHGRTEPRDETLVIVKGYEGRSIVDLADDPQAWSGRDAFLRGPWQLGERAPLDQRTEHARAHLRAFIDRARTEAGDGSNPAHLLYAGLRDMLQNANWAGVLILGCDLGLGELPAQIQGLLGGMDPKQLRGEFVAIELKGMTDGGTSPQSCLSALVDYRDDGGALKKATASEAEPEHDGSYGFKVNRLLAGFANGEVSTFAAAVDFYLGRLFHGTGSIFEAEGAGEWRLKADSVIGLDGRYERSKEGGQAHEVYAFETRAGRRYKYEAASGEGTPIIKMAEIRRVSYVTDSTEPLEDGSQRRQVSSRFLLDGKVEFGAQNLLDVLDIEALDFAEMGISTGFRLPSLAGGFIEDLRMFFNPGRLRFLFGSAKRRGGARGFWSSFPLKFRAFTLFDRAMSLPDLGFFGFGNLTAGLGFRFGLEFDLDLGFLGSLAPKGGLKLSMLFGFTDGFNIGDIHAPRWQPRWALGFKFPEGDGRLDIGIEGVLKLTAERCDIVEKQFGDQTIRLIYAIGAQMEVLGYKIPSEAGLSLFVFVDPEKLGGQQAESGVGWFAARRPTNGDIGGVFDLKAIALGQRIDPLPAGAAPRTTQEVVDAFTRLTANPPFDDDPDSDGVKALDQIVSAINHDAIRFAPERGWSVGFSAVFAQCVELGLAMRDDDIYGLRVAVRLPKGAADPLFSIDVLYRKLTDTLGVYSAEILPPPAWRQLEFGVVSVTLPMIAFEIFTDGGFTIDLGYPFDKNYARAFGVQILPFIGSGGFYFRRVQGPAAWLVPQPLYVPTAGGMPRLDPARLTYRPVTEVGLAFRVGLGKEIIKGPFRAGLSLTVFAELQGGYGVLWLAEDFDQQGTTQVASTFIAVRGQLGVLGEIYGYVDFGIVKAGVSVRIWVATGFDLKTDHKTRLYIEAGVEVRVSVVIARFRVFGHTIEISIHFSFSTTVEFSTYVGSDRNLEYYSLPAAPHAAIAAGLDWRPQVAAFAPNPAWDRMLAPADWRAPDKIGPLALPVYLMADVTLADEAGAARPHAVLLCMVPDHDVGGQAVMASELAALLAAWAISNHAPATPGLPLRDWPMTVELLDEVAAWVAAADSSEGYRHASERRLRQPAFGLIDALMAANVVATLSAAPAAVEGQPPVGGVFLPLPPTATISRLDFASGPASVRLADQDVVDDAYRDIIDREMQRHMAVSAANAAPMAALAAPPAAIPIAQALFEDHIGLVMRMALARLGQFAAEARGGLTPMLGQLLDMLAAEQISTGPLAAASRLAMHAPRLPYPLAADAAKVPSGLDKGTPEQPAHHSLYRLAWLQLPMGAAKIGGARRLSVDPGACFLQGGPVELDVDDAASDAYDALAGTPFDDLGGRIGLGQTFRTEPRGFVAGRPSRLAEEGHIVFHPADLVRHQAATADAAERARVVLDAYPVGGRAAAQRVPEADMDRVIAVRLRLKAITADPAAPGQAIDRFEIAGMAESDRVWLDLFEDGNAAEAIADIALYAVDGPGFTSLGPEARQASVVQADLSAEPGPDVVNIAAAVSDSYVAGLDAMPAFVDIVRRAGITNRTGTTIGWPGAKADGATTGRELLMVVHLRPDAAGHANALVFRHGDIDANAFVFEVESAEPSKQALVVEPLAAAGVVPVLITRPAVPAPPAGVEPDVWSALASRFSMFAYSVRDEAGAVLVEAGKSLAVGPTDDGGASKALLEYRLSLPVQRLLGHQSPYEAVGRTLTLGGAWRDVYGNDWPGPGLAPFAVPVRYTDRLIPLNDLPGLVLAWWPGAAPAMICVAVALDPSFAEALVPRASVEMEAVPLDAEERAGLAARIERSGAIYRQIALQMADPRIAVAVEDGGATAATRVLAGPTAFSAAQLADLRALLDACATLFAGMAGVDTAVTRAALRGDIAARLAAAGRPREYDIVASLTDAPFAELSLSLSVTRDFNPVLLPGEAPAPPDVLRAAVPLPLPLRDERVGGADAALPRGFGRTIEELRVAVGTFAPGRLLATGHGAVPGLAERAVWLVDDAMLPPLDHFSAAERHDFALPPISTSLHSFELEVPRLGGGTPDLVGFKGVDADATAAKALSLYDEVLAPSPLQVLAGTVAGREAVQRIIAAKGRIAVKLARRLHTILADDVAPNGVAPVALLQDRLLARLSNANAIDALSVVIDKDAPENPFRSGPQAFGAIGVADGESGLSHAFRTFVMAAGSAGVRARHLVFATDVVPAYVNIGNAVPAPPTYRLTHVQRRDRPDINDSGPGAPGRYRPTAWLKLVESRLYPLPTAAIPIVHKRYPAPPAIRAETWTPEAEPVSVAAARLWSSTRDWTYEAAPADRLTLTLRYNPGASPAPAMAAGPDDQAAEWTMAFALFAEAVEPVMRRIDADADGDAIAAFLAERAEALEVGLTDPQVHVVGALRERVDIYRIVEAVLGEGQRTITLERDPKAAWPQPGRFRLHARPDAMEPVEADSGPVTAIFVEGDGLAERRRRLEALGLDILSFRTVQTELQVRRNAEILGHPVAEPFIYRLPVVASGAPLAPLQDVQPDIAIGHAPASFRSHLERMLAELLDPIGAPPGAEAEHDQILGELSLNLVVTHEPLLAGGIDIRGDGTHVSGVVRAGLQREGRPAWVDPLIADAQAWRTRWRPPSGGRLVFDLRLFETQSSRPLVRIRRAILPFDQVAW